MKVVLCGPPHSGKSCLREGLKRAIIGFKNGPYPYVITACPDGEGAWYSEAARRDPVLARQLKEAYKGRFTDEFAAVRAQWVKNCQERLTLVDVGGKIDDKNRLIMQYATHAVILAGDMSRVEEWRVFCDELNLKIVAVIHSDYEGVCDRIECEEPILRGSVHYLERGVDVSNRLMVQKLGRLLCDLCEV